MKILPVTKTLTASGCGLLLAAMSPALLAATIHDEATAGDLSGDPLAPTALTFAAGSNVVTGTVVSTGDIRDYLSFTVGPDQSLTGLTLLAYSDVTTGGTGNLGWLSLNAGATSFVPAPETANNFLGGVHASSGLVGVPLFALLASGGVAGTGFVAPLGPGSYTFLIQQTSGQLTGYSVDFQVAVVPLPGALWLLTTGVFALGARGRRLSSPAAPA
jgi:hypothetical protein